MSSVLLLSLPSTALLRMNAPVLQPVLAWRASVAWASEIPANVHTPFTREEDVLLWSARDGDLEEAARRLGRGPKGVAARLKRLRDPSTEGHSRLFGCEPLSTSSQLRPVRDVVQRILWDKALPAEDFVVGYRDRFRVVPAEVRFGQPNTGKGHTISSPDTLFVLALPEHRIEYLLFRRQVVWHKALRLDLVFGSGQTNGTRIQDVVQRYDAWEAERKQRVKRAKVQSAAALGAREKVVMLLKLLSRMQRGECNVEEFVQTARSEAYFGPTPPPRSQRALLALVMLLPDEHAHLRSDLVVALGFEGDGIAKG